MTLFITSIAIVLRSLPFTRHSVLVSLFMVHFLLSIVDKSSFGPILMVEVLEALVVNSQLKDFSVLDDVEHVVSNLKRVLERSPKLLDLKGELSIFKYLLLSTYVTANQFNGDQRRIQVKLPNELRLRSTCVHYASLTS